MNAVSIHWVALVQATFARPLLAQPRQQRQQQQQRLAAVSLKHGPLLRRVRHSNPPPSSHESQLRTLVCHCFTLLGRGRVTEYPTMLHSKESVPYHHTQTICGCLQTDAGDFAPLPAVLCPLGCCPAC